MTDNNQTVADDKAVESILFGGRKESVLPTSSLVRKIFFRGIGGHREQEPKVNTQEIEMTPPVSE